MTNHKAKRAKVAQVHFGAIVLAGLMSPNGLLQISVSQCAETFQLDKTIATRTIKGLLGKDSQLVKIASELNPKPVNCIVLLQLEKLIIELALKGNVVAAEMLKASIGMTLTQRFADAFGIKLDRAEYLKNRIMDVPRKKCHPLFGDENMDKVASFIKVSRNHPKLANWMWTYIYCTFSDEEVAKLNQCNPVQPDGHRRDCIHQWLEENSTIKHKEHFDKVLTLVEISTSEQEFADLFARMFSKIYQQTLF